MADPVKIYDNVRRTEWLEGHRGYGTVTPSKVKKQNWANIFTTWKKKPKTEKMSSQEVFSGIPVNPHLSTHHYATSKSSHIHHPMPHSQQQFHHVSMAGYAPSSEVDFAKLRHQYPFTEGTTYHQRKYYTVRSHLLPPHHHLSSMRVPATSFYCQENKRSSIFDGPWATCCDCAPQITCTCQTLPHPHHQHLPHAEAVHFQCPSDCPEFFFSPHYASTPSASSSSRKVSDSSAVIKNRKIREPQKLPVQPATSSDVHVPPSSSHHGLPTDSHQHQETLRRQTMEFRTSSKHENRSKDKKPGGKYSSTISGGFVRSLRLSSKESAFNSISGRKSILSSELSAYDLIKSQLDDEDVFEEDLDDHKNNHLKKTTQNLRIAGQGVTLFTSESKNLVKNSVASSPTTSSHVKHVPPDEVITESLGPKFHLPDPDYDLSDEDNNQNNVNISKDSKKASASTCESKLTVIKKSSKSEDPLSLSNQNKTSDSPLKKVTLDPTSRSPLPPSSDINSSRKSSDDDKDSSLLSSCSHPSRSSIKASSVGDIDPDVTTGRSSVNVGVKGPGGKGRKTAMTMMKLKLNKRGRKHVTFRSYKDDSLILEHINEPIPEEDESDLYDDIHEPGQDNQRPKSSSSPSNFLPESTSQDANELHVMPFDLTSSFGEANSEGDHDDKLEVTPGYETGDIHDDQANSVHIEDVPDDKKDDDHSKEKGKYFDEFDNECDNENEYYDHFPEERHTKHPYTITLFNDVLPRYKPPPPPRDFSDSNDVNEMNESQSPKNKASLFTSSDAVYKPVFKSQVSSTSKSNKIVIDVPSPDIYGASGHPEEHIYEEIIHLDDHDDYESLGVRSMFDGATKDDILEYLEDAKERVQVLITNDGISYDVACEDLSCATIDTELPSSSLSPLPASSVSPALISSSSASAASSASTSSSTSTLSASRRNRSSNVSNSSADSAVTTSSSSCIEIDDYTLSTPVITRSASLSQLVERNDSGVGAETSKPARLRRCASGETEQRCTDCDQPVDPNEDDISGLMFYPLTCLSCEKKRSERKEIISEFVDTEFKYGRDLRIIKEEFYHPMEVAQLMTKDQLNSVFLNLDELIYVNTRFAEKLADALDVAIEQGDEDLTTINLGKLFMDSSASMLQAFETFCNRQASASLILTQLEKEKELLRIFLRVSQMENTLLRRMNLSAFLMVPVQRVTKYPLLLGRLFKVTPIYHQDRENLRAAQQKVELHLEHINEQTKSTNHNKIWKRIQTLSVSQRRRNGVRASIWSFVQHSQFATRFMGAKQVRN